ncbi:DUF6602 domain-containing protein [Bacillus velezensis]|uniref:DUF6602 domain-containing protein n=1 Tax=Bacillus velezensis TaxID=492670 RepID=UPI002FBEDE5C
MINTVADMLLELKKTEEEKIKQFNKEFVDLKHPTIVGDMFEGTAQKILEKSIFKDFDLRVVSGQIINKNKEKSGQIDCMIVEGEGVQIPNTEHWIYDISQVIAVIEVKKNLNKNDLIDSYAKMLKISDIVEPRDITPTEFRLFRDSFRSALGMDVPEHEDVGNYDLFTQMMYHSLLMETVTPLRVVFGFYGYSTMKSLRKGFIQYLNENVSADLNQPIKGFSPYSFPNLIFTRDSSLIKINGIPYHPYVDENGYWECYTSSNHNPLFHFLEMLWTKLSYKHGISSDIFGEDLKIEGHVRFLRSRPISRDGKIGWEFAYAELPDDFEVEGTLFKDWEPAELSGAEHLLMVWLCNEESINTNSEVFQNLLHQHNLDELEFLAGLKAKKLVYKDRNNELKLLTDECLVVCAAGKFYAGENRDRRMNRWLRKTKSMTKI